MLKKFKLGDKEIPVPVPLKNLHEAMDWIDTTFIRNSKKDQVLTCASIDGRDVLGFTESQWQEIPLTKESLLEVKLDSPRELSSQTVEAVRDLAHGILTRIKPIAVKCWDSDSDVYLKSLVEIYQDLELIQGLVSHVSGIMDYTHREMAPVSALSRLLRYPLEDLKKAMKLCNWKVCSHILLNRIEPLLFELEPESQQLQLRVLSSEDDREMIPERRF